MNARHVALMSIVMATGCLDAVDARWELDHDHVIAVRATPPRIMPGDRAVLDALVAHDGAPTAIENATQVTTPTAPAELQGMVSFDGAHWTVTAPTETVLASSRPAMGVETGAPVPLDLLLVYPRASGEPMYVTKTVWLDAQADNPPAPAVTIGDVAAPDAGELVIPVGVDVYVEAAVATGTRVNWLTSCGTLFQDDEARAFVRADEATTGELAVVIRAPDGGVNWRMFAITAR
ncbi:MAG TPA: hypothetical protein VFQ53_15870 [Kofleriaceae bacterium]|nr:hypothetical protein [Kofleriaceae bacterium]